MFPRTTSHLSVCLSVLACIVCVSSWSSCLYCLCVCVVCSVCLFAVSLYLSALFRCLYVYIASFSALYVSSNNYLDQVVNVYTFRGWKRDLHSGEDMYLLSSEGLLYFPSSFVQWKKKFSNCFSLDILGLKINLWNCVTVFPLQSNEVKCVAEVTYIDGIYIHTFLVWCAGICMLCICVCVYFYSCVCISVYPPGICILYII